MTPITAIRAGDIFETVGDEDVCLAYGDADSAQRLFLGQNPAGQTTTFDIDQVVPGSIRRADDAHVLAISGSAGLDNCPSCGRRIADFSPGGLEAENAQRWCIPCVPARPVVDEVS